MNQIKIGIPRALLYYRYKTLWKHFFENLNCKVIISPETTYEIFDIGKKNSIDEACLSYKIFLGHVSYLKDKCDYILIPRIVDYGKNEKVCLKFNSIYDEVKTLYPKIKILNYNIEYTKNHKMFKQYMLLGLRVNKNIFKVIKSYLVSYKKQLLYSKENEYKQEKLKQTKTKKILIVSHPYNIYDKYLSNNIIKYIKDRNIDILYADRLNKKISIKNANLLSDTIYWKYSKEIIGSINYYKKYISGIIFLTSFPCGVDSLVNELMIRKITDIPILNLIIDESLIEVGVETRLESFIDIIKGDIYEKNNIISSNR